MNPDDPNLAEVELAIDALGNLADELVVVGGCAVGLLITDTARPPNRETKDVDMVAEVLSIGDYYTLGRRMRARGFKAGTDHLCRWLRGNLVVDVMPTSDVTGGSTNKWYAEVMRTHQQLELPSGKQVRIAAAPEFVATKLEAFHDRGQGDYSHHDIEDLVNLVDGRMELAQEIKNASPLVREFIRNEFDDLLADIAFIDHIPWHLSPDAAGQERREIVIARMREIAGI
jgi:predicted nucleotidyltransferase